MNVSVSRLEMYRRFRQNEAATVEDWPKWVEAPTKPLPGACLYEVLRKGFQEEEADCIEAGGYTYVFDIDVSIVAANPAILSRDYGDVTVTGLLDYNTTHACGAFKAVKKFDAEKLTDGYQWRLLLDIFRKPEFVWHVFVIMPDRTNPALYRVREYHKFSATAYPDLHADCSMLVSEYQDFARNLI